jgi:hypothetical protein
MDHAQAMRVGQRLGYLGDQLDRPIVSDPLAIRPLKSPLLV